MYGAFVSTGFCHPLYLSIKSSVHAISHFSPPPTMFRHWFWASESLWLLESAKPSWVPVTGKGCLSLHLFSLLLLGKCHPRAVCFVCYYKSHTNMLGCSFHPTGPHHMERDTSPPWLWDITLWWVSQSAWECPGLKNLFTRTLSFSLLPFPSFSSPHMFQLLPKASLPPHRSYSLCLFFTLSAYHCIFSLDWGLQNILDEDGFFYDDKFLRL